MKNIALICLLLFFYSCSGSSNNTTVRDSNNAIEDHPLQDTTVDTLPNGYSPPNNSNVIKKDSMKH